MRLIKQLLVVLIIVNTSFFVNQVGAHSPENIDISYNISTQILTVTITHNTANPNTHYVEKVQVYKNEVTIIEKEYTNQPSNTFILTFNFPASIGDRIKVEAECKLGGKTEETITVMDDNQNNPPTTPVIQGQTKGKAGTTYEYRFYSSDSDGDNIYYCIQWGDNSSEICIGPFPSGVEQKASHVWNEEGSYIVKIKARDIKGNESNWGTLPISMPKRYPYKSVLELFLQKFEFFPLFEKILNQYYN